jgi:diguanylate cyclase (GGDEF)-like protein
VSELENILLRRIERERAARAEAERLLEKKSLELHEVNFGLRNWTAMLEEIVKERTADLTDALEKTREANSQIEHQAMHDPLTGLPNRRYLKQVLKDFSENRGGHKGIAILHIDLDKFKQINDTRGHAAGDYVLTHAAAILKSLIRKDDFVARIGGDEFVIVAPMDGGPKSLTSLAERITTELARPVLYKKNFCRFGASVGIAYSLAKTIDPSKLLVSADIALYRAKNDGRGRYAFYSHEIQKQIVEAQDLAEGILTGLDRNEFFPIYQPQFDATSYDVVGVEAMVRWNHPQKGVLEPEHFLKIAENIKVINDIDGFILDRTLRDIACLNESGTIVPKLSVNTSFRRLSDPALLKSVTSLKVPKGFLAFELIESAFLDDKDPESFANKTVKRLRERGIGIEVDDFGTGNASIVSLLRIQPSRIKIAKELVTPIDRSRKQRRLLRSIIEMGKALNIGVTAEGVETMEHAKILADLGCDILQGFAFAVPMTAPELFHFLKTQKWRETLEEAPILPAKDKRCSRIRSQKRDPGRSKNAISSSVD